MDPIRDLLNQHYWGQRTFFRCVKKVEILAPVMDGLKCKLWLSRHIPSRRDIFGSFLTKGGKFLDN